MDRKYERQLLLVDCSGAKVAKPAASQPDSASSQCDKEEAWLSLGRVGLVCHAGQCCDRSKKRAKGCGGFTTVTLHESRMDRKYERQLLRSIAAERRRRANL